jgi:hypothetical protein
MRGAARGAAVAAEPGATLVAGRTGPGAGTVSVVRAEAGATLLPSAHHARPVPARAAAAPRPQGRDWRAVLRKARPEHVAIVAGAAFAAVIGLLVLLVVLLSRVRG